MKSSGFDVANILAVGHRVVHGGEGFVTPTLIDADVLKRLGSYNQLAPLHNPANLAGIAACREFLPGARNVAVFDTAFYRTVPDYAYVYALPWDYYAKHRIRKYGFHGISHEYVTREAARVSQASLRETEVGLLSPRQPKYPHDAAIFYRSRLFLFADPSEQGRFVAMLRDLGDLSLRDISLAVIGGCVRREDGRGVTTPSWHPGLQIFPLSRRLADYFNSVEYARRVEEAAQARHWVDPAALAGTRRAFEVSASI